VIVQPPFLTLSDIAEDDLLYSKSHFREVPELENDSVTYAYIYVSQTKESSRASAWYRADSQTRMGTHSWNGGWQRRMLSYRDYSRNCTSRVSREYHLYL
jgi:hypothetical protein